jgi:hypothetical protein
VLLMLSRKIVLQYLPYMGRFTLSHGHIKYHPRMRGTVLWDLGHSKGKKGFITSALLTQRVHKVLGCTQIQIWSTFIAVSVPSHVLLDTRVTD